MAPAFTTVIIVVFLTEGVSMIKHKGLAFKPVIGGFVLGLGLLGLSAVNAGLGKWMGYLILISVLINDIPIYAPALGVKV